MTTNGTSLILAPAQPMAVAASGAALLIDVSRRTWDRMTARGLTPRPLELGGGVRRWSVVELGHWVEHGCPPRERWEVIKSARPATDAVWPIGRESRTSHGTRFSPRMAAGESA